MSDTYTTTTRTSWLGRIKDALAGIIIGPIVIIASIYFLGWNEGRSATTIQALQRAKKDVVPVSPKKIDPSFDGKLVYTTGPAETSEVLEDSAFNISRNALVLRRNAEMYQWQESEESKTQKNLGGSETTTTTYSYSPVWSSTLINSTDFKQPAGHQNPSQLKVASATFVAQNAKVGQLRLDTSLLRSLEDAEDIAISTSQRSPAFPEARPFQGWFYLGANADQPQIGDVRVNFSQIPPQAVSVVGAQLGDSLTGYTDPNGYLISLIRTGTHSATELLDSALMENSITTWLMRLGGLLFLFIGFALPMKILSVLADVVPFIGNIVGLGTGLLAFSLAAVTWSITIAIAWFANRPIHAIILLALISAAIALLYRRKSKQPQLMKQAA